MGPTDSNPERRRQLVMLGLLLIAVSVLAIRFWKFSPPQIGTDEEVFKTVDALFTAVTSHSQKQLEDCAKKLSDFRRSGSLPDRAAIYLESLIQQARAGKWEQAAKRLYEFMYGQRRQS
jgi:hypothetical protein